METINLSHERKLPINQSPFEKQCCPKFHCSDNYEQPPKTFKIAFFCKQRSTVSIATASNREKSLR
jgi:hypothetical protein